MHPTDKTGTTPHRQNPWEFPTGRIALVGSAFPGQLVKNPPDLTGNTLNHFIRHGFIVPT